MSKLKATWKHRATKFICYWIFLLLSLVNSNFSLSILFCVCLEEGRRKGCIKAIIIIIVMIINDKKLGSEQSQTGKYWLNIFLPFFGQSMMLCLFSNNPYSMLKSWSSAFYFSLFCFLFLWCCCHTWYAVESFFSPNTSSADTFAILSFVKVVWWLFCVFGKLLRSSK